MDLIQHFATLKQIPMWLPGQTPLLSKGWLGQMNRNTDNPTHKSNGMAFNGTDHFSTFTPDISINQRAEAHLAIERALNGEALPQGWICVRGTKKGQQTGSEDLVDGLASQPDDWHPINILRAPILTPVRTCAASTKGKG